MMSFKAEDMTLILGLRCKGDIVSFKNERVQCEFEQLFLSKMDNRHSDAIKDNLFRLVPRKYGKDVTFVKLLAVYLMTTIFFPSTSLNVPIFAARYTDEFTSLAHNAWAHVIHRWLMVNLPTTVTRVQLWCKGNYTTTGYLKECAIAIIILFY
ncbi:hypothetical protein IHE45_02G003400 [Dioscorea alata]|uniref:Uncharacterized protein n=1 Tax=Dioscorea alata TaxID=55571 RepID=A0ACB7WNG5_DIOAL|nr:hypothetical protein IHE45_02G003400 [Dioscorea alata]